MPYLDDSGIAIVCVRDEFLGGIESTLLDYPEGVPFSERAEGDNDSAVEIRPSPPDIAVWCDRTIVWSKKSREGETSFWIGRVSMSEYEQLEHLLDRLQIKGRFAESDNEESVPASSNVVGTLSVATSRYHWVLVTELPQMQELKKYWFFNNGQYTELPMKEYSFEEYCSKLPSIYATQIKSYAALYSNLKALNPSDVRQIDVCDTVSWVVQSGPRFGITE